MLRKLITLEIILTQRIIIWFKTQHLFLALILLSKLQMQKWKRRLEKILLLTLMNYLKNLRQFFNQILSLCSQNCNSMMGKKDQKSSIHYWIKFLKEALMKLKLYFLSIFLTSGNQKNLAGQISNMVWEIFLQLFLILLPIIQIWALNSPKFCGSFSKRMLSNLTNLSWTILWACHMIHRTKYPKSSTITSW